MPGPRFQVTELEGWISDGRSHTPPGISCQVIDAAINHRLVALFRSEDHRGHPPLGGARSKARRDAAAKAAELNAALDGGGGEA